MSEIKKVLIFRESNSDVQSLGTLKADTFNCKTLELPWKNNAQKISCIPVGMYRCKFTYSRRFKLFTYEIFDVPNRAGIRIHSANFTRQLLGCIALGATLTDLDKDGQLDTTSSRSTVFQFEKAMGCRPFDLVISDVSKETPVNA